MCNGQSGCGQVFPSFRLPSFPVGRAARGMSANVEISYKFTCLCSQWYISMCACVSVYLCICANVFLSIQACTFGSV